MQNETQGSRSYGHNSEKLKTSRVHREHTLRSSRSATSSSTSSSLSRSDTTCSMAIGCIDYKIFTLKIRTLAYKVSNVLYAEYAHSNTNSIQHSVPWKGSQASLKVIKISMEAKCEIRSSKGRYTNNSEILKHRAF